MAYIEQADLLTRMTETELVQTTNDAGGDTVDTDVLDGILSEVDAIVDAHVGVRYSAPVESPSQFLKNQCLSIVVFKLMNRRGMAPEHVERNYDDAMKILDKIAKGQIEFADTALKQPASLRTTKDTVTGREESVFDRKKLEDF